MLHKFFQRIGCRFLGHKFIVRTLGEAKWNVCSCCALASRSYTLVELASGSKHSWKQMANILGSTNEILAELPNEK